MQILAEVLGVARLHNEYTKNENLVRIELVTSELTAQPEL